MSFSLRSRSSLRLSLMLPIVIFIEVVLSFAIFSGTYAAGNTGELSGLLTSELNLEISEDGLNNLPVSKQQEMIKLLSIIQTGRTLFVGKTPAEKALGVLTELISNEVDEGLWDITLNSLLKLTHTPVSTAKGVVDDSKNVFLALSTIQAMQAVPRERLVLEYVNLRTGGKNDESAWKEMADHYKQSAEMAYCNLNASPQGDGDCQRAIVLNRGGEPLHSYTKLTYESFNLAQQLNSDPRQKEALKQWVISEIEKAQNTKVKHSSFFSRLGTAITAKIAQAAGAIQTFVTNAAQIVTNSLKIASTGVKDFFTGTTLPKETEIKPSDLSGQISSAIPANTDKNEIAAPPQQINALNQQEQLRQAEEAKKKQAEAEKLRLDAEQQKQEDQRKIEEQRRAQSVAEEALKKTKTTDEQPNSIIDIEPSININGVSGMIFLNWPSSYTVYWTVPNNWSCMMYGYFGDQSQGSIWKDVKESGSLIISNLPDPDISMVNGYAYALECSSEGIHVGDSVQLKVIKDL